MDPLKILDAEQEKRSCPLASTPPLENRSEWSCERVGNCLKPPTSAGTSGQDPLLAAGWHRLCTHLFIRYCATRPGFETAHRRAFIWSLGASCHDGHLHRQLLILRFIYYNMIRLQPQPYTFVDSSCDAAAQPTARRERPAGAL